MLHGLTFRAVPIFTLFVAFVNSQVPELSSFPHSYPGIPNPHYIYNAANQKQWQDYYRVNPLAFPNVTQCRTPTSFAGNVPVNRANHPNNTLFFWAIENKNGSFTDEKSTNPWAIWLNGGPGSSSLLGAGLEHGPCLVQTDNNLRPNPFSLHTVLDVMYIDQPVGVGYATADPDGFIADEDQMGDDFMGFLTNVVHVFPALKRRPLYIMGESYAGTYIPYILKASFKTKNPPVNIVHAVIGDGGMMTTQGFQHMPTWTIIETYPQIIDYDINVYKYFIEQTHLCGYDINLSFPQPEPLPSLRSFWIDPPESDAVTSVTRRDMVRKNMEAGKKLNRLLRAKRQAALSKRDAEHIERELNFKRAVSEIRRSGDYKNFSRRNLAGRANGTLDSWYQCGLLGEMWDYAVNFTAPWSRSSLGDFDLYFVLDALSPEAPEDPSALFTNTKTVAALHAPQRLLWSPAIDYPFGNVPEPGPLPDNDWGDPSSAPVNFFSELASNCSKARIRFTFIDGQVDARSGSYSTIATIQNITFNNIRGFTQRPSTAWYNDKGQFAGVVHQERGFTYILVQNAGHQIPMFQPENYNTALRQFVLGNNKNGSIDGSGKLIGTPFELSHAFNIPGEKDAVFTGSGATQGSTVWPSATIAAWEEALEAVISPTTHAIDRQPTPSHPHRRPHWP